MKVAIVGGGPAGLYLGLLLKRKEPGWNVEVIEQNQADATFGFGVVLADSGMQQLKQADQASHDALCEAMRYNERQVIVQRETPIDIKLNVKGGAIPRLALLRILRDQAENAGVTIHYGRRISSLQELDTFGMAGADVVVGADGINSMVRGAHAEAFGTTQRSLGNHFAWYGTRRVFESPALVFRKYEGGHFVAHYYAYSGEMSTFVAECDDATWLRLGMDQMTDDERQALFERIFAPELQGQALISNKSVWRQFPVIRNARWVAGRHVLIGDALASAHFSIGSGTRIAMNDAAALAQALLDCNDQAELGLARFEECHRGSKNRLIDASEHSYMWYEDMAKWMEAYTPEEFVYQFMTRTGRIDDDRLKAEFPELMQRLEAGGFRP